MCTLIAFHRCVQGAPLVVAANRDEFLERPTEGPALREASVVGSGRSEKVVAPRDVRAGGTWLGLNASGLFAAVTNRRAEHPDPERRSRGWLVMEALTAPSAAQAARQLESLPESSYNSFNLFVADRDSAHLVTYADRPERIDLEPGPHVIGNVHPAEASPKLERLRGELARLDVTDPSLLDELGRVCRVHRDTPFESTCVHAGEYGTRSSTLLRIGSDPVLRYAEGAPCEAEYRDLTPLLHEVGIVPAPEGVQA